MAKLPEIARENLPARWVWLTEVTIAGNELWRILALFLCLLTAAIGGRVLRMLLMALSKRLEPRRHLLAVGLRSLARSCVYLLVVLGLKVGMEFISMFPSGRAVSDTVCAILVATALGYVAYTLVDVVDEWLIGVSRKSSSKLDDMLVPLVRTSLRATIIIMVLVQMMTIISDKPVTSVIAGLGVGGLAIGLAAQDTIKNVFGSMMIFSDRPFELGDEIVVDTFRGNVERVGLRSTRFRTADGHIVTIPNGELANKTIVNVSRRPGITRTLNLGLSHDTSLDKAHRAVAIVQEVLRDRRELNTQSTPQVCINDLSATSLNLMVSYMVSPPDWSRYLAFNQWVNLEILRRFREEEIRLAVPIQTIHLRSEDSPPQGSSVAADSVATTGTPSSQPLGGSDRRE